MSCGLQLAFRVKVLGAGKSLGLGPGMCFRHLRFRGLGFFVSRALVVCLGCDFRFSVRKLWAVQ